MADLRGQLGKEAAVGCAGVGGGCAKAPCHHVWDGAGEPLGCEADAQVARAWRDHDDVLPALGRLRSKRIRIRTTGIGRRPRSDHQQGA